MKTDSRISTQGQTLVIVALSLVALMAFVALAVDGGHVYSERRSMQNAADAGALAGAYELCFGASGTDIAAENLAREYAVAKNGAHGATVTVSGGMTVTVVVTEAASTFFAGLIGFPEVDVQAEASAVCAKATSAGLLWPVGFSETHWPGQTACDEYVILWEEGPALCDQFNCCTLYEDKGNGSITVPCDAAGYPENLPMDARTWTDFSAGITGTDPCDSSGCGNDELRDRILGYTKLPGNNTAPCESYVEIPKCIPGDMGVRNDTWTAAGEQIGNIVRVPLYDPSQSSPGNPCVMDKDPGNECTNDRFYITSLGCVQVDGPYVVYQRGQTNGPTRRVILVHIPCESGAPHSLCATTSGGTSGERPEPGDLEAVSLIR